MGRVQMANNYFSASEAAKIAQQAHYDSILSQKRRIFSIIREAAQHQLYRYKFNEPLYPETQQTLREYGYGVVCPDDGGKCWEISWDSSSTPVQGADSRRWNN